MLCAGTTGTMVLARRMGASAWAVGKLLLRDFGGAMHVRRYRPMVQIARA